MSKSILSEISENVTLYHRSKYPMKVGDIIKPKKDEDGKHWTESVPSEVALELMRRKEYPDRPSRFNCVYSSVIPRSRFVDKGMLYVVKPKGKMIVTDSALIDKIHEQFDRRTFDSSEFHDHTKLAQIVKAEPERLEYFLPYLEAKQYWEGSNIKRKEDIEVLSDEAVVIEIIDETGKRLTQDKVYIVKEDDKLFFTFRAFGLLKPGTIELEYSDEWKALYHKIVEHIFSKVTEQSKYSEWERSGWLRKGLRIKFVNVQSNVTKSGDEASSPESKQHLGKYKTLEIAFEMDGKWYSSHGEKNDFQFSLSAHSFMKNYHDQPYDYGKHVNENQREFDLGISDSDYYNAASDFLERKDKQLLDLAELLKKSKGKGRVPWKTVSASLLKRVWLLFGKTHRINNNDIDKIADQVLTNIARLSASTEMMGHTPYDVRPELEEMGYVFTDEEWDDWMANYFTNIEGSWLLSDYGLPKLEALYSKIFNAHTSEEKLYAVDKALNVVHQRNDLAAMFVEGGTSTLNYIASQGGYQEQPVVKEINEAVNGTVVVGMIMKDGLIISSDMANNHAELVDRKHIKSTESKLSWRYNKNDNIVYWWPDKDNEISDDDKESVEYYIKNKYEKRVLGHKIIALYGKVAYPQVFFASHGQEELDETAESEGIIVGETTPDGVISSDDVGLHSELDKNISDRHGKHWRYNSNTKDVYWWGEVGDEVEQSDVNHHLKKKYGVDVNQHLPLNFSMKKGPGKYYRQRYNLAHGLSDKFGLDENTMKKLLKEEDPLMEPIPIVVGLIVDDGEIVSYLNKTHADLQYDFKLFGRRIENRWRYNTKNEIVYWVFSYTNLQKEEIEHYLRKKYNYRVKKHIVMKSNEEYATAHGFMNENTMKKLLKEGIKEKTAEDFIRQTIKGTEWEGKVFVAGGYVRDEFMGKDPKDLDLLVNKPNGGIDFANWITTKIGAHSEGNPVTFPRFGTAKFNLRGITHNGIDISDMDIEAVMPRKEQYTAGSRKPDVSVGELKDDVERRDFTVNSLLKDLSTGEILDLTGMGKDDIKAGIVRTPLSPDKIFTDDPLRMLRAVRFAIKYHWNLPMFMLRGLKKNSSQLQNISQERIRDELDKMLLTGSPDRAIKLLKVTDLLQYVIPEMKAAVGMTQNKHHRHDVFSHTLQVIKGTQPVLIQRLAALFHDIGKTVTRSVTPTGVHFYGHEDEGEKITEEVMRRLKYPIEIINAVKVAVRNHMRLKSAGDTAVNLSDKALRKFRFDIGDELENVLNLIHSDNISHSDASSMPNQIINIRKRLDALKSTSQKPNLPINGNDLIKLGLKPGPIFTQIMKEVTDAWFENPQISKSDALEIVKKVANI